MMRFSARALLALVPLAALPATAPLPRALDGYTVTQRITSDMPQAVPLTARVKVAQGRVRVDVESAELAQLGGMYMLLADSGKIITVMAQMGMAMKMDASVFASSGVGGMGAGVSPTISDVSFTVDDLGAGETIVGAATHKYRFRSKYNNTSQTRGALKGDGTIDVWIAPQLGGLSDGLQKFADTFGTVFSGMAGGGSKALSAEIRAKMPKGYTMKAVIKLAETDVSGKTENTTTTVEVTEHAKASFEATAFDVPANIQVMDMNSMLRGRGGRN